MSDPGISIAERANSLSLQNHATQCSLCTCNALLPASNSCEGALLDSFPPAKQMVICEIAAAEHMEACLSLAATCEDARQCQAVQQTETAKCPTFDPLSVPPVKGC